MSPSPLRDLLERWYGHGPDRTSLATNEAVALAHDRERLEELRRTLRDQMVASPLMDAASYARDVEAAFRQAWREWCDDSVSRS